MTRLANSFVLLTVLLALGGCAAMGEIAYDAVAERDLRACEQIVDATSHRACVERVRAVATQAQKARANK